MANTSLAAMGGCPATCSGDRYGSPSSGAHVREGRVDVHGGGRERAEVWRRRRRVGDGGAEPQQLDVPVGRDADGGRTHVPVDEAAPVHAHRARPSTASPARARGRPASRPAAITSSRRCPDRSSRTTYGWPSSSPQLWTAQMWGWVTSEATCACRRNRSTASWGVSGPRRSTWTATMRWRRESRARQVSIGPSWPMSSRRW